MSHLHLRHKSLVRSRNRRLCLQRPSQNTCFSAEIDLIMKWPSLLHDSSQRCIAMLSFQCNSFMISPGVDGWAVRFLVVGTIGQEERPPRGQLWMEQCLTSLKHWLIYTQYEQMPIILGVWPFWLTLFFFSVNNILAGSWLNLVKFPLLKLLSFFWLTYYCSIRLCFSVKV